MRIKVNRDRAVQLIYSKDMPALFSSLPLSHDVKKQHHLVDVAQLGNIVLIDAMRLHLSVLEEASWYPVLAVSSVTG